MRKTEQSISGLTLFSLLPQEMWFEIAVYLNAYCQILNAPATETQEKQVVDVQFDVKLNENITVLTAYHLIMLNGQYQLGFCDDANQYRTKPLDDKGPLKRYITNHDNDLLPGVNSDVELFELVEREIQKAGGKINPARKDLSNAINAIDIGIKQKSQITNHVKIPHNFFKVCDKTQAFDELLLHVARGEQKKANAILKKYPELLLLKCNGYMKRADYSSRTFKNVSAFQLALWAGDWHMWKMMLSCIPSQEKEKYGRELLNQYDDLMSNGLQYRLDNLTLCGLRIIQGTPTQEQQNHAKRFNAYHLIIKVDGSYSLGFYDQATKTYVQKPLSDDNPLKQHVKPNAANPDTLSRDSVILKLVSEELMKMGAIVHFNCCEPRFDLKPLIDAIKLYDDNYYSWQSQATFDFLKHQWTKVIGILQRFLPPHVLHEYLRKDRLFNSRASFTENSLPRQDPDWDNFLALPFLSELGFSLGYIRAETEAASMLEMGAGGPSMVLCDFTALVKLDSVRTEQLKELRHKLLDLSLDEILEALWIFSR